MAINPPRLSGLISVQRRFITEQPVSLNYNPPSGTPDYEGQIHVQVVIFNSPWREGHMYVAAEVQGILTWVRGDVTEYINSFTGSPWDPNLADGMRY